MINYCSLCFLPDTKPDLTFNSEGICAACVSYMSRTDVNWRAREQEFLSIARSIPKITPHHWDCVIPVSGGKDSTAQVLKILELGLNPICVTSTPCDPTPIGRRNIENIKNLGVDYVEFSPNPKVRKQLNTLGLTEVGDISWPEHVGIFTIPVQVSVRYRVPLIIWGENSQNEYGGPAADAANSTLNRRWLEEFGGLLGMRVSDLAEIHKVPESALNPYTYPSDEELLSVGTTGLFLGHYFPWDGLDNYLIAQASGFESFGKALEGSMVDYENLDNYHTGIHDYFKFIKFGFGRATDIASIHIRRGRLSRAQALKIIKERDGQYPHTYLGKTLMEILEPLGIDKEEFDEICDRFTNKKLFITDSKGNLVKDRFGNLTKVNYDN